LRRQRRTQAAIAAETGLSAATVSRILRRRGLSLLSALERFQRHRSHPGALAALDSFAGRAIRAENRAPLFLIAL
jgi:hypothetical protein